MKIYAKFVLMTIKSQMQYKSSFFMSAFGQFLISFTAFLSVYFMYLRFNVVNGYDLSEILLCFSIMLMSFSIAECFFRGFDVFPRLIRSGDLDRILIRPRNIVLQVLTSNIEFTRVGRFLQALIMLAYAVPSSGVTWTYDKVITLIFMLIGGIIVFASTFMLYAGVSFFTIDGIEFMNIFTDGVREFGRYPLGIYGDYVLKIFTFVVPVSLFQYYPLLYLIGDSNNILFMFLPLFTVLFTIPCYLLFRFGLSKYKSTGS